MADVLVHLEELQADGLHPLLGSVTCPVWDATSSPRAASGSLLRRHAPPPLLGRVYGLRFTVYARVYGPSGVRVCFYVLPISTRPVRARIVWRGNLF